MMPNRWKKAGRCKFTKANNFRLEKDVKRQKNGSTQIVKITGLDTCKFFTLAGERASLILNLQFF